MPRGFILESSILEAEELDTVQPSVMPQNIRAVWCSWHRKTDRSRACSGIHRTSIRCSGAWARPLSGRRERKRGRMREN